MTLPSVVYKQSFLSQKKVQDEQQAPTKAQLIKVIDEVLVCINDDDTACSGRTFSEADYADNFHNDDSNHCSIHTSISTACIVEDGEFAMPLKNQQVATSVSHSENASKSELLLDNMGSFLEMLDTYNSEDEGDEISDDSEEEGDDDDFLSF